MGFYRVSQRPKGTASLDKTVERRLPTVPDMLLFGVCDEGGMKIKENSNTVKCTETAIMVCIFKTAIMSRPRSDHTEMKL